MKKLTFILLLPLMLNLNCKQSTPKTTLDKTGFEYIVDRFADIEIMRYYVDDWEALSLQQKKLVYYLSEAALCGRDIIFDQNCKYNLLVKSTLENIVETYTGDKSCEDWENFMTYVKRFWFSNGIHHHYSNNKFFPDITESYFFTLLDNAIVDGFDISSYDSFEEFTKEITQIIFNPAIAPTKISPDSDTDLIVNSAANFYEGVTQKEVEEYYNKLKKKYTAAELERPISFGLNSFVTKDKNGKVIEETYKIGGKYSASLEKIVYWLEKAVEVAENDAQKGHLEKLIEYYKTGDLKTWDDYNVLWVQDLNSHVDYVNGFIEVYSDPMGQKATWEAVVNYKDLKNLKRTEVLGNHAQWFEDNSPVDGKYKKDEVKGVVAKVITVAHLGGECYPATPIGINLPNANWIRKEYGSKSVTMENIVYAFDQARMKNGTADEFYFSEYEVGLAEKYGYATGNLLTDMHECLGHGSGQMMQGVGDGMLKNYHSPIEETRADLFALYYLADPKLVELGLLPNEEAYKAGYYKFIVNGILLQLNRIELGDIIAQAHMRDRALIARWCYEAGKEDNVIELISRDGKTYIKINDYEKLRELFGQLLAIIQDIKSTGNYDAAKNIIEKYAVKIDPTLHKEVKDRFKKLDIAPYGGFVNPQFIISKKGDNITDITIDYSQNYVEQMMEYGKKYRFLSE